MLLDLGSLSSKDLYRVEGLLMDSLHSSLRLQGCRVYCITGLSNYPYLRNGSDNLDSRVREGLERERKVRDSSAPNFPLYFEILTT